MITKLGTRDDLGASWFGTDFWSKSSNVKAIRLQRVPVYACKRHRTLSILARWRDLVLLGKHCDDAE